MYSKYDPKLSENKNVAGKFFTIGMQNSTDHISILKSSTIFLTIGHLTISIHIYLVLK